MIHEDSEKINETETEILIINICYLTDAERQIQGNVEMLLREKINPKHYSLKIYTIIIYVK